jgi:hypothetical protein
MMSFGGAGPGIAILTGVAKGIREADRERRRREQEAIINRLREEQIRASKANSALQVDREMRMRDQNEADALQKKLEREAEAAAAQAQAARRHDAITVRTQELADQYPEYTPEEIFARASGEVDNLLNVLPAPRPEPVEPDPEIVAGRQLRNDRLRDEDRLDADVATIMGNNKNIGILARHRTLDEALEWGNDAGLDPLAVEDVWERLQNDDKDGSRSNLNVGDSFELTDRKLQRQVREEAEAQARDYLSKAGYTGDDETGMASTSALQRFNEDMVQLRQAQSEGMAVSDWHMALFSQVKDMLIRQVRTDQSVREKDKGFLKNLIPGGDGI